MLGAVAKWIEDRRWAANALRARRFRRGLTFSKRMAFDRALRQPIKAERGMVIDYPDTFYRLSIDDLCRAIAASTRQE